MLVIGAVPSEAPMIAQVPENESLTMWSMLNSPA
jgi:hypothetical protein